MLGTITDQTDLFFQLKESVALGNKSSPEKDSLDNATKTEETKSNVVVDDQIITTKSIN